MATSYTHSIPTPPFSPQNYKMPDVHQPDEPLKSTINLLDALVGFYQNERMWVYRTRATLEDAFASSPIGDDNSCPEASTSNVDQDAEESNNSIHSEASKGQQQTTRWHRRKKGFKLRIDGIRAKRVISTQPQTQKSEQLPPREQILDMYEKMMEARMESCQRLNKLVRDANRANLHHR